LVDEHRTEESPVLLIGVATFLVGFPCILAAFASIGLATAHGDGILLVAGADVVLALSVAALAARSKTAQTVVVVVLICAMAALAIQAIIGLTMR
jgi:hypothetical protein